MPVDKDDELHVGVDIGKASDDKTALMIQVGPKAYHFTGEEADAILQLIHAREERFHDAFERGQHAGRQFERFLEDADWMKNRKGMIEMFCLQMWHRSYDEVKNFPNDRALSVLSDFMKMMDAIVDKEVGERLQSQLKENKEETNVK